MPELFDCATDLCERFETGDAYTRVRDAVMTMTVAPGFRERTTLHLRPPYMVNAETVCVDVEIGRAGVARRGLMKTVIDRQNRLHTFDIQPLE